MTCHTNLITLIMICIPFHAWTAPQSKLSPIEIAQKELIQGHDLIKANKIKEGIRVLRRAYRAYPSPEILMFLGKLYDRFPQGCVRALSTWRLLVDTCQDQCPMYKDALAHLKIAELECRGSLTIKSDPPNAEVFIGDRLQGVTPFTLRINEAKRLKLMIFKHGYEVIEHRVMLTRQWKQKEIKIKLNTQGKSRGVSAPNQTQKRSSSTTKLTRDEGQKVTLAHNDKTQDSKPPQHVTTQLISSAFDVNEDPFLRLESPPPITHGQIATSAGRSMVSSLRCEYRTRFRRYIGIDRCDGAQLSMYDRFYVALKLQQDAYVYIIMSNHQGQWQLMFPKPSEDHLIKAEQLITLPHKEWIILDQVENTTDSISILASPEPIPLLEQQRAHSKSHHIPRSLMRYFVPMSDAYQAEVSSAKIMSSKTQAVTRDPLVLHTSYRIHR